MSNINESCNTHVSHGTSASHFDYMDDWWDDDDRLIDDESSSRTNETD